jgi:putative ABC transport system permease protein
VRHLLYLAVRSAWNRRLTLAMTLTAIALSVALLLGVDRVRRDARESFSQSVSGTDLIVGARTSPVQLMLYSVFRMGEATNTMQWQSFEQGGPAVAGRLASGIFCRRDVAIVLRAFQVQRRRAPHFRLR